MALPYILKEFPAKLQMYIIIFNIIIVFMLLACIIFSLLFLDKGFAFEYLRSMWPLGFIFIALPVALNVFFWINRQLFALLEREDWSALAEYLEKKIYQEGHYNSRYVQLFAQSCLSLGYFDKVIEFSQKVFTEKPALLEANALIFGAAHLLSGNNASAADFYRERLEKASSKDENYEWIHWYYGFSLTMLGQIEQAGAIFGTLANSARGIPVTGLSSFFLLEKFKNNAQWSKNAENGRDRVCKVLKTIDKWNVNIAKLKTKVHGTIIRNYLDETGLWLYRKGVV
jgi:tetratricopeptide (TPR) repeat protein